jgi:hypothetical protein
VAFHAFALLVSLVTERGSHTSAIIAMLVVLWVLSNGFILTSNYLSLGSASPFYASELAIARSWSVEPAEQLRETPYFLRPAQDVFFGHPVQHFTVLLILDTLVFAWLLLALVRNIKRDPSQYELYSPFESLGITLFVNLLLLAFIRWDSASLADLQAALFTFNIIILSALGLAQLRNRDRTRRILRSQPGASLSALNLAWPAPFLLMASALASLLICIGTKLANANADWSFGFALFRSLFFVAWFVRDLQFLQWMTLRRGKRPMVMGLLFLSVFYACVYILLTAFKTFQDPDHLPFSAFFLPTPLYYLDHSSWAMRPAIWSAALVAQILVIGALIVLQRDVIRQLAHTTAPQAA